MHVVAVGFMISLPFGNHILLVVVGFLSSMGLSIWLSVANQPSFPAGSRRSRPALYRAASDRLGFKVSLIWVQIALGIVLLVALVISVTRPK